jgi:hypothetical protein
VTFPGGSAWAMVREISEGFLQLTERSFARLGRAQLDQLSFELERRVREVRGTQPPLEDQKELLLRNRRLQRLVGAQRMLQAFRMQRK